MPMAPMYILIILIELIRTLPKEHHRITCHSQERTQLSTRGAQKRVAKTRGDVIVAWLRHGSGPPPWPALSTEDSPPIQSEEHGR